MAEGKKHFRVVHGPGKRKPDRNAHFRPLDPALAQQREEAIQALGRFQAKPPTAPERCPYCGMTVERYHEEHPGEELLRPGGHPFICAMCGNTEWNG